MTEHTKRRCTRVVMYDGLSFLGSVIQEFRYLSSFLALALQSQAIFQHFRPFISRKAMRQDNYQCITDERAQPMLWRFYIQEHGDDKK